MSGEQKILCVAHPTTLPFIVAALVATARSNILMASNTAEATQLLKTQSVDVIVLECLPGMTDIVDEAKRRNRLVRVLLLTEADIVASSDFPGVDAFLRTPASVLPLLRELSAS